MRKVLLLISVVALTVNIAYPQSPRAQSTPSAQREDRAGTGDGSARQVKAGEAVPFGDTVLVKAAMGTKTFEGVKVKGQPLVVVLEMEAGRMGATFFYKLSADSGSSEIYLLSGAQKIAPRAVIEDFPSWGRDNDKEVDTLDPKETIGGVTLNFQQKGSISLLFDVPPAEAKTVKKLSVSLRLVQPKDDQRTFVVTL